MGLTVAELEQEIVSQGSVQTSLLVEVTDARGTAGTLGARLDVALNPDGTPRTPVATVSFVPETAPIISYPPTGAYVALDGNLTSVYVAKRRLRINGALLPYVTSSTYDVGGDYTVVNFSTPVGNSITSVEYSFDPAAMPPLHYSGNPDIERVVSGLDDFATKHLSDAQYKSLLDDILARVTVASLVSIEDGAGVDLVGRAFKYVDTIDDLRTLTPTDAPVYVQGHTTIDDGGQGTFYWDEAYSLEDDNGMIVLGWCRARKSVVNVANYGVKLYDNTAGEANYNAIRAALKYCQSVNPGVPYDGQAEMEFPEGTMYIMGNSPFCYTRTELEAMPDAYRYRRGMSIKGAGRLSTNLVLQNNGSQSWFWDNYDANYTESNRSVASTFTFEGISFKAYAGFAPTRRYSVEESSQVCGFRFYSGGWESFMVFNECSFQGLDTALDFEGTANVDHNTFNNCLFQYIIDNVLILNNDQVVQTRFNSTDFLGIHGNCFKVLGNGGGNILMNGGSVVLYPKFKEGNVPDLDSTENRGFYYVDLADHGTSTTLGPGNNKCEFNHLRFEIYDDYQKTVYATRDAGTVGGSINPYFENCSWVNENNMDASGVTIAAPDTLREAVVIQNNIAGNVTFKRSTLHKRHQYVIRDNDAAALAASRIQFDDCELYWDPNATTLGGGLRERCILDSTDDGMFVGNNIKAITTNVNFPKVRHVFDFAHNVNSGGATIARNPKMADMLSAQVAWPQVGATELKVFLPEGSVVYGIKFYKPAQSPPAGTPVNLYYILEDYADNDLYLTTNQSEVLAINVQAPLTAPYTIPAAPNNYVTLKPAGASGTAQPVGGYAIVEYF